MKNEGFSIFRNDSTKNEIINLFEEKYHVLNQKMDRVGLQYIGIMNFRQQHFLRKPGFRYAPLDFDALIDNHRFHSWLVTAKDSRDWINWELNQSLKETQRVLELINDELKQCRVGKGEFHP